MELFICLFCPIFVPYFSAEHVAILPALCCLINIGQRVHPHLPTDIGGGQGSMMQVF